MLVISGLLFVLSAVVATAAFAAIHATGASGVGMDVGGPIVNALLNAAGVDHLRAPESQDSGASWLIVATFLIAFFVAGASLLALTAGGLWLHTRWASGARDRFDRGAVVEQATMAGRRQATAALERGSQEYAKAKPKLAEAAQKGRKAFDDDVRPRVATSAGKAAAKGRRWIEQRRNRPPGGA